MTQWCLGRKGKGWGKCAAEELLSLRSVPPLEEPRCSLHRLLVVFLCSWEKQAALQPSTSRPSLPSGAEGSGGPAAAAWPWGV